jgi:2-polyprenyl-3-methyl-5-hydroxy-6-metoxy-1,4-benzoquinol methylase
MKRPFIDFYTEIGFAPTGQQVGISQKHRVNRTNLYRKLGLHSQIFRNANVLEIGPGSGENAMDLLNRGISSLTISDGAQVVLDKLKLALKSHIPIQYELCDSQRFSSSKDVFDIVVCEGVIPLQMDPTVFFQNICQRVAPGGIILVTTMDSISSLSEVLRRIISFTITTKGVLETKTIEDFFRKDFEQLEGMTRTAENWVLDSILNPWIGKMFSISDAILAAPKDFRPISMTPNLHLDQDWYKNPNDNSTERRAWVKSYLENCHRLINFQDKSTVSVAVEQNNRLVEICDLVFLEMQRKTDQGTINNQKLIINLVNRIVHEFVHIDTLTKNSLKSFVKFMETEIPSSLDDFRTFWGRGQQYLCFENTSLEN